MNNEMKVTVQARGRYGTWFYYPTCEKAEQFRQIEGGKTLTAHALKCIRQLGYEIEINVEVPETLNR